MRYKGTHDVQSRCPIGIRSVLTCILFWAWLLPCSAQGLVLNERTGETHTQIQEAIDEAVGGDILSIDPVSWQETLHIDKDLTLIGNQPNSSDDRFRLSPDIDQLTVADHIIRIRHGTTVTIYNLHIERIRESRKDQLRGVGAVIFNYGYLRLKNALLIGNRTLIGAVVNSGTLLMQNVAIEVNLGGLGGPGGGLKNRGRLEADNTRLEENDGFYGGLYNSGGESFFFFSFINRNFGDYGAFYNAVESSPGSVLGFYTQVYDNSGAIASDFRDPYRGDWLDPEVWDTGDCKEEAPPQSVNPCGEYDSPQVEYNNGDWLWRGLYWL